MKPFYKKDGGIACFGTVDKESITQRHVPEDSNLHIRSRETHKPDILVVSLRTAKKNVKLNEAKE
jgi:hypothetical protein